MKNILLNMVISVTFRTENATITISTFDSKILLSVVLTATTALDDLKACAAMLR
jgi:hypothetical protein